MRPIGSVLYARFGYIQKHELKIGGKCLTFYSLKTSTLAGVLVKPIGVVGIPI